MDGRRVVVVALLAVALGPLAGAAPARLAFSAPQRLAGAAGGTEPQLAVASDGTRYAISGANTTSSSSPSAINVFRSSASGGRWTPTGGTLAGVRVAGPDVAVVASGNRLIALEEDSAALSLVVNWSDDGGRHWTASTGLQQLADQDRPWLAVGPGSVVTLLFHNGFSSNATHNMYVETSRDRGASFGAPVPITLPGSAAWADLQCADSGGASALLQNRRTGRLYAVWGSRHGPAGGCGVNPPTPFTLVPATRVWVATSATGALGTWTTSLAVDDSAHGNVVGMQLSPAALDSAGNVWLAWTTPPHGFPDDSGAGISLSHADPMLQHWSTPRAVVTPHQPGVLLAQLVAGDPGRVGLLYLTGRTGGATTRWYPRAAVVTNTSVSTIDLSSLPSYQGTATALEGSGCDPSTSPVGVISNNPVTCVRAADVIGIAVDKSCRMVVSWPTLSPASSPVLGASSDATWVATQTGGPRVCAAAAAPAKVVRPVGQVRSTGRGLASTGLDPWLGLLGLGLLVVAVRTVVGLR
ncbi:MAG: repeat-like domain [Frankiales bacterium]|nr:repeat-like domain [Frankiales bacterium]